MQVKGVQDAEVAGKRVLLRVDYNVPIENSVITNDSRMRATLPTINLLRDKGVAKIMLATHLGRPGSKVVEELRTAPLFAHLRTLTDTANIDMLENLRFNPGEESNDPAFAAELASKADIFVNDAFAASHRAHASIVGVAKLLPAYAGLLMEREIEKLSAALAPQKPSLAIVSGVKLETKLPLIEVLAKIYDKLLVGGALADEYKGGAVNVLLPEDGIPEREHMFDIGPKTRAVWAAEIQKAAFVLWNGPVGMYEKSEYSGGTNALAAALASSGAHAVIGGGDTDEALAKVHFDPEKVFISTGGGATLEFVANGTLPGIEVLKV
ncbi:MAG: phosphoglycerate kinase [Minisyncoccia bacterium]|jgi:phosphoglycerate kinase